MRSVVLILLGSLFIGYLVSCTSMGTNPTEDRLENIRQSKQYNIIEEQFQNPKNTPLATGRGWTTFVYEYFFTSDNREPKVKLPEVIPDSADLRFKSHFARFIWFGHSTILLELNSIRVLIDPVFSQYASPVPGIAKRFQAPVLTIDEISDIDFVLISHDHYDHLDYQTISKLKSRNIQFIVPLGVGAHLEYWDIDKNNIFELDWWDNIMLQGIQFTCTPSQHFSGRGILNGNTTLWAGWAIKGKQQNIFFSGDSGYSNHYEKIGNRLGPFDLTFLENGAYSLDWKFVHQLPEEAIQAHLDLKGKAMVPIHWGMFDLALHTWFDPITRVTAEAKKRGVSIITPKLGQVVATEKNYVQEDWWSPLINANQK